MCFFFLCIVEDRNFALFNFVNEQNNEAEALREQIRQVSREGLVLKGHCNVLSNF